MAKENCNAVKGVSKVNNNRFENLVWENDRMFLDDLVFLIEYEIVENQHISLDGFRFYKEKTLIDEYARFWESRPQFQPENLFELGIWDGGSIAFWFEIFEPKKHVAIDISSKKDSEYFQKYVSSRNLEKRIRTFWRTDQRDSDKIRDILSGEFGEPLDLVIDDASHLYGPTKRSFETLFPFLCPGGLYIIEDWGWAHCPQHIYYAKTELTKLIFELVEATASAPGLISSLLVYHGFVAVERGEISQSELKDFELEQYIYHRPTMTEPRRILSKLVKNLLK